MYWGYAAYAVSFKVAHGQARRVGITHPKHQGVLRYHPADHLIDGLLVQDKLPPAPPKQGPSSHESPSNNLKLPARFTSGMKKKIGLNDHQNLHLNAGPFLVRPHFSTMIFLKFSHEYSPGRCVHHAWTLNTSRSSCWVFRWVFTVWWWWFGGAQSGPDSAIWKSNLNRPNRCWIFTVKFL